MALPDGQTITVGGDGDFEFPVGTVLVKSFRVAGKLVETRLMVRHADGAWGGYTYEWDDAQKDATLLAGSKTKAVGNVTWYYPSRADCFACHTQAAGHSLGLELGQQNGDFVYPTTNRISNQPGRLERIGMFSAPLGRAPTRSRLHPDPSGTGTDGGQGALVPARQLRLLPHPAVGPRRDGPALRHRVRGHEDVRRRARDGDLAADAQC